MILSRLLIERRVEGHLRRLEIRLLDRRTRLRGPVLAFHSAVLPLHLKRTLITDVVKGNNDLLEVDVAVPD